MTKILLPIPEVKDATSRPCYCCGKTYHSSDKHHLKSVTCHYCEQLGHIKSVCMPHEKASKTSGTTFCSSTPCQLSVTSQEYEGVKEYTIFTSPTEARLSLSTRITVNGQSLCMEVNTDAVFSVSSINTCQELFSTLSLQHNSVKVETMSPHMRKIPSSFTKKIIGAAHLAIFTDWIILSEMRQSSSCSIFSLKQRAQIFPCSTLV